MKTLAELEREALAAKEVPIDGALTVELRPASAADADRVREMLPDDPRTMTMNESLGVARAAISATLNVDGDPSEDVCEALLSRSGGIDSALSSTALSYCGLTPREGKVGNAPAPRGGSSRRSPRKQG